MTPSFSHRASYIVQSEIRPMTIECEKVDGTHLAQGVCVPRVKGVMVNTPASPSEVEEIERDLGAVQAA